MTIVPIEEIAPTKTPIAGITEEDVYRFTEGDCHYLARALHIKTGWPLLAFTRKHGDGVGPDLHAFVQMPGLRILDVEGPQPVLAFKTKWINNADIDIAPFTWRDLRNYFGGPEYGNYTYARAHIIADRLLALPEVASCL